MEKLTSQELLILSIMFARLWANPRIYPNTVVSKEEIETLRNKIAQAAEEGRI